MRACLHTCVRAGKYAVAGDESQLPASPMAIMLRGAAGREGGSEGGRVWGGPHNCGRTAGTGMGHLDGRSGGGVGCAAGREGQSVRQAKRRRVSRPDRAQSRTSLVPHQLAKP